MQSMVAPLLTGLQGVEARERELAARFKGKLVMSSQWIRRMERGMGT